MKYDTIESPYPADTVNIMQERKPVAKWEFGMAPISQRMRQRYNTAVSDVSKLLNGEAVDNHTVVESISELKGMFSRHVRKDRWDYAMVGEELGNPPAKQARLIANDLLKLRRALIANDVDTAEQAKKALHGNSILKYLQNYEATKEGSDQNIDGGGSRSFDERT